MLTLGGRLLLCVLPVALGSGGGRVVLSQKFLDYAVAKIVPLLETAVQKIDIPGVSGTKDKFKYSASDIKISTLACASPAMTFIAGQGFALDLTGISLKGSLDWHYKADFWPHEPQGKGTADVKTGGSSYIRATVETIVQNDRPQFVLQNVDVHFSDFDIDVHGSMFSWLYNLLVDAFNNHIRDGIQGALESVLKKEVANLNEAMAAYSFTEHLPLPAPYDHSAIDFTISNVTVGTDHLSAEARGEVFPTDTSSRYPRASPLMPSDSVNDTHHIKADVSSFIFDSAFYTYTEQNLLKYLISPGDIPSSSPVQLKTTDLAVFAPELLRWPGANMSILANTQSRIAASPDAVSFVNNSVVATFPGSFAFNVIGSNLPGPAFVLSCPLRVEAGVSVQQSAGAQVVHFTVNKASCTPLTVNSSAIGPVSAAEFSAILNIAFAVVVPVVNKGLSKGVPLPSAAGISLVNTEVVAADGKLEVKTDMQLDFIAAPIPTYTWPALLTSVQQSAVFV